MAPCRYLKRPGEEIEYPLGDDVKRRIHNELAAGYVVALPDRAVKVGKSSHIAWWRIDPRSGRTTGVTETGLHGAETVSYSTTDEYFVVTNENNKTLYVYIKHAGGRRAIKIPGSALNAEKPLMSLFNARRTFLKLGVRLVNIPIP